MECQPCPLGPDKKYGNSANEVSEISRPDVVWNDHHGEKRYQRSEEQAIDEDHQAGFFQILQLGVGDLAVYLRQRLLATHGQYRMPEADEQNDDCQMADPGTIQPSQRLFV